MSHQSGTFKTKESGLEPQPDSTGEVAGRGQAISLLFDGRRVDSGGGVKSIDRPGGNSRPAADQERSCQHPEPNGDDHQHPKRPSSKEGVEPRADGSEHRMFQPSANGSEHNVEAVANRVQQTG